MTLSVLFIYWNMHVLYILYMKSICNIKINGTHIYGRLCTLYFFDGSFLSRSEQKRIIYFFFKGIGVFSSWRIQMFIYTHKGINFWWVFAWNIFVLQVGIISDNRWKPTVSLALTNDISEFPLPHNMFTVQNRIVVVFGLLFFVWFFFVFFFIVS